MYYTRVPTSEKREICKIYNETATAIDFSRKKKKLNLSRDKNEKSLPCQEYKLLYIYI